MWILCLYFVFCLFLAYHYLIKQIDNRILIALSIFMFVLIGLSFPVGRDINAYISTFDRAQGFMDAFKYHMSRNFGFNALMVIVKWFTSNAIIFRIIINFIVTGLFAYVIIKHSKNILLSCTLLLANGIFVVYFGSALRQAIAMGIFLVAYFEFYLKERIKIYLILSLLAFSFHEAAIIMFILPIFDWIYRQIKNKTIFYILMIALSALGFVFIAYCMPLLFDIFKADSVFTHFLSYFKTIEFSLIGLLLRVCMIIANGFIFIVAKNKSDSDVKLFNCLFLSFILYFSFAGFSIFSRIADFLAVLEIIFIPSIISKIEKRQTLGIVLFGIFCLTSVLFLVDLKEVCSIFDSTSILNYPYIGIFDLDNITLYLNQI